MRHKLDKSCLTNYASEFKLNAISTNGLSLVSNFRRHTTQQTAVAIPDSDSKSFGCHSSLASGEPLATMHSTKSVVSVVCAFSSSSIVVACKHLWEKLSLCWTARTRASDDGGKEPIFIPSGPRSPVVCFGFSHSDSPWR